MIPKYWQIEHVTFESTIVLFLLTVGIFRGRMNILLRHNAYSGQYPNLSTKDSSQEVGGGRYKGHQNDRLNGFRLVFLYILGNFK
jgi:hypothetical protein